MSSHPIFGGHRPLVAILRGLEPEEALDMAAALIENGIGILEVPLNSPEPFESIGKIAETYGNNAVVGAGTVLTADDVHELKKVGGKIVVSPNMDPDVIETTKEEGLLSFPGVFTPTEAFAAIDFGADALKFFPSEALGPTGIGAMMAVIPKSIPCLAVGGVGADNLSTYLAKGVAGFGIGSSLFKPGISAEEVGKRAIALCAAYDEAAG